MGSKVKLDVGGHRFSTSTSTLTALDGSMLASMFSGRFENKTDEEGYVFIDRDGTHFRHVLNFMRNPQGWLMPDLGEGELRELENELQYYGLTDAVWPNRPPRVLPEVDLGEGEKEVALELRRLTVEYGDRGGLIYQYGSEPLLRYCKACCCLTHRSSDMTSRTYKVGDIPSIRIMERLCTKEYRVGETQKGDYCASCGQSDWYYKVAPIPIPSTPRDRYHSRDLAGVRVRLVRTSEEEP